MAEGLRGENVTEKPVRDQANLRSPPATDRSREVTTSCGLTAPCNQQQGALHIVEGGKASTKAEVACDSDFDAQEALRNFQSYIDILREWDEKEQAKEKKTSSERSMMH
jgi:hypothetical protein